MDVLGIGWIEKSFAESNIVDGIEHVCFSSTIRPSEDRYIFGKGVSSVAVTAEINQRKAFEFHCLQR
jgi:hypothetical protein